jgi:putative hydrolase of the HAD superfamily
LAELQLPAAIIFDLDDTIIAHSTAGDTCWRQLCERFAPLIPGLGPDRLYEVLIETTEWYWGDRERHRKGRLDLKNARREAVSLAFRKLGIADSAVSDRLADAYTTEREEAVELFPGAVETLKDLRDRGVSLGMVTGGTGENQRKKINRVGLEPYFDYIAIEGEFGVGKPDARIFLHVLEKLGISAAEAWMVGDSLIWDIAGAKEAGIYSVWVDWRGRGLPESAAVRPDRIIRSISELVDGLLRG